VKNNSISDFFVNIRIIIADNYQNFIRLTKKTI